MHVLDIIAKKRDGLVLDNDEIDFIIEGYTAGTIPDYQMSAWLMAVYLRGLNTEEIVALTKAMTASGEQLDLSAVAGIKVDKHSTGGVADTTTLVLAPLVAAAGVKVAKMSGRGLGFTGGTIDKLEAIPGFRTDLSIEEFTENLKIHNVALMGQTAQLAPADGKIYALRDVTGTVASIGLIASSIMSKKIAAGADRIVLDVKVGSGAFMRSKEEAQLLAKTMVLIGNEMGRKTIAVLTNMDEPLGQAIGNTLEVEEAIAVLQGKGPEQLRRACLELGSYMLLLANAAQDFDSAYAKLTGLLDSGVAFDKFQEFIKAQGGKLSLPLPKAKHAVDLQIGKEGYIGKIDTAKLGYAAMRLGAGREYKGQQIDLQAGIMLHCRVGDKVNTGSVLATLYTNDESRIIEAKKLITEAVYITTAEAERLPLTLGVIQ